MEEKRLNELICLHGQSMNQFPEGSDGQRVFADTVVILGAHVKLVAALKTAIPAMEYKLSHLQARQARIDAARVLEQARAVLKELGEL